jgi:uncharacterized protein
MLTGPLPERVNHRKFAEEKTELDGTIPLSAFTRLVELLADDAGEVGLRLRFRKGRKQRSLVIGDCRASVQMICQNCLEPVQVEVEAKIRTLLLDSLDELVALRQSEDGTLCDAETVSLVDILEDDLIVSLPMVARHAPGECVPLEYPQAAGEQAGAETFRPFAGLAGPREDLKRS